MAQVSIQRKNRVWDMGVCGNKAKRISCYVKEVWGDWVGLKRDIPHFAVLEIADVSQSISSLEDLDIEGLVLSFETGALEDVQTCVFDLDVEFDEIANEDQIFDKFADTGVELVPKVPFLFEDDFLSIKFKYPD